MQAMDQNHEKRRYFRVTPSLSNPILTTIRENDIQWKSLPVKDISLGGVAFYYPNDAQPISIGTNVPNLQLTIPQKGQINASGVVRRIDQNSSDNRALCALEFTRMPTSSDRTLYSYLNERQREISWFTEN
jgi:c-di-GMP-binding flagellar brake protein YcgR